MFLSHRLPHLAVHAQPDRSLDLFAHSTLMFGSKNRVGRCSLSIRSAMGMEGFESSEVIMVRKEPRQEPQATHGFQHPQ